MNTEKNTCYESQPQEDPRFPVPVEKAPRNKRGGLRRLTTLVLSALPSVVSITNISVQEVQSYFNRFGPGGWGQTQMEETTSCGSGVIISQDENYLYIVTNQHVVADATTLSVSFVDNAVYEAQLCGSDEEADLAVIKVP